MVKGLIGGMLFAEDFVGVSDSKESLLILDIVTVVNADYKLMSVKVQ